GRWRPYSRIVCRQSVTYLPYYFSLVHRYRPRCHLLHQFYASMLTAIRQQINETTKASCGEHPQFSVAHLAPKVLQHRPWVVALQPSRLCHAALPLILNPLPQNSRPLRGLLASRLIPGRPGHHDTRGRPRNVEGPGSHPSGRPGRFPSTVLPTSAVGHT